MWVPDIQYRYHQILLFSNILKATANDEVSLENGSLTKSQKNFSTVSSTSNNRSPVSAQRGSPVLSRRREVTEEEAERSEGCFYRVSAVCLMFSQCSCDSQLLLCAFKGSFSRWTRQRSPSSVGTDTMQRDGTLTSRRSNTSSPVRER